MPRRDVRRPGQRQKMSSRVTGIEDWDRLRAIVAPTLLVLFGLCAFTFHIWLMARLDRLSRRD